MAVVQVPESVLAWVVGHFEARSRVSRVCPLREVPGERGPWLLTVSSASGDRDVVLKTGPLDVEADDRGTFEPVSITASLSTEAAALDLAESHGLPTPRLIGVDLHGGCGRRALLTTAVAGQEVPDEDALAALGAVLPRVHAVQVPPSPHLPPRTRARQGEHYIAWRAQQRRAIQSYQAGSAREREELRSQVAAGKPGWPAEWVREYLEVAASTPLIEEAERVLEQLPHSTEPTGLVHNDIAIGNVIWSSSRSPVVIDWEGAGSGPTGLDLGNARFEVAMHYGPHAADTLLRGWTEWAGAPVPDDLPYWDLSATLNTPADLRRWAANLPRATESRDAFIEHVLERVAPT